MVELGLGLGFEEAEKKNLERRHHRSGRRRGRRRAQEEMSPDSSPTIRYASNHRSISNADALAGECSLFFSTPASTADDRFGSDPECATDSARHGKCIAPHQFPSPNSFQSRSQVTVGWREEDEKEVPNPANQSVSHVLPEFGNTMGKPEACPLRGRMSQRHRTASLDLNGKEAAALSPPFFVVGMKKSSVFSSRFRTGTFPSPGTLNYQKGWSSERVPLPSNVRQRYGGSSALFPFSNGRALPSKWEDAEKWICSPVSGDVAGKALVMPAYHRRPKAKSGPLGGLAGGGGSLAASPLVPCFDSGRVVNVTANSPFLAGVLVADRQCRGDDGSGSGGGRGGVAGGARFYSADAETVHSASLHGWLDMLMEPSTSLPSSQDDKIDKSKEAIVMVSPGVLQKDMATQMSPGESSHSSPKSEGALSSFSRSAHPTAEGDTHLSKVEVRDVQVDDQVTVAMWSKNHIARGSDRCLANIIEWRKKTIDPRFFAWDGAEASKRLSKYNREEARITAWENLQKAKAEAAIHKLEMKLDKKRSSSLDKILNKLRSAQRKAQEMRNAAAASQACKDARTTRRVPFFGRSGQMTSLSGCFTGQAS